ncbi:MAG: GTPase HflX [Firmicutes bacterium]|nr:GTPase HflX [Bacillota bacterium]
MLYEEFETEKERVILVAVEDSSDGAMDTESSLAELALLADTAGAEAVCSIVQKREAKHRTHYVGKGKLEEIKVAIAAYDATGIICDDELSPSQMRNMGDILETKVMDRTMLILDIFAQRARSKEGKLQVELAQLKYRLTRLTGQGTALSRLGGGIGTRGPGEKKLETDRRHIKEKITELKRSLLDTQTHRELLRANRKKQGSIKFSLIGYTNAGKSTILNTLTDAGVLAEDKLFATLDPTTRKIILPGGTEAYLTDTVGFIQKLPHQLIDAFKATLEELRFADFLVHVVDASNPLREEQMAVVYKTVDELKCGAIPVITLFNKTDLDIELPLPYDRRAKRVIKTIGNTPEGLKDFLAAAEELIKESKRKRTLLIPYAQGGLLKLIYNRNEVLSEEHTAEGTLITAYLDEETDMRLRDYDMANKKE